MHSVFAGMAVAAGILIMNTASASGLKATFTWLYDPAAGTRGTVVAGVSADGRLVCGAAPRELSNGEWIYVPVYWDEHGIHDLPIPDGQAEGVAEAVSDDGRVIVGSAFRVPGKIAGTNACFAWTLHNDGTIDIETTSGGSLYGLSPNGEIRVGRTYDPDAHANHPFVWYASGERRILPTPPGSDDGAARSVSNDGTIVGYSYASGNESALRWRSVDEYEELVHAADSNLRSRSASCITPDGRFIGGNGLAPLWSDESGWHGDRYNWDNDFDPPVLGVWDMTPDASFMVGFDWQRGCTDVYEYDEYTAEVWDPYNGTRRLSDMLRQEYGIDVGCLFWAAGVSHDGRVIVGTGLDPSGTQRGYVLTLPPPCVADANGDKQVNGADLSLLLASFGRQTPPGLGVDLNHDGRVNNADLSILLFYFNDPC